MEGTTKLEHSVLVESLDSRLTEGMLSPEPLEQLVLNTLLVARPMEGYTETNSPERSAPASQLDYGHSNLQKLSDWEPAARPVPDITLDGRLMEGTTYLERSALGVSLDSGLMEGMSSLEPLEQSVLNTLSAARPEEGITEELSDREPVVLPVPDITLDGRPMEGTTYLEHSALGVSLDSGLMAGMSRLEPFEQSVLGTWLVARPVEVLTETDTPERSALASQVDYGHSKLVLLSPENTCLGDKEMSLDEVRSEGPQQWNMDVEYQYETFNGVLVYYGGDMYDSEDAEDDPLERAHAAYVEDYNFDVPEGMELMAYNRRRPDGVGLGT